MASGASRDRDQPQARQQRQEHEWEEVEEDYAVVTFSGLLDPKLLKDKLSECRFFNLEGSEPLLEVGHLFFRGSYDNVMGTAVCFEELNLPPKEMKLFKGPKGPENEAKTEKKRLVFEAKTDKSILMKRVFLEPKESHGQEKLGSSQTD